MLKRLKTEKYYHYETQLKACNIVHEFLVQNKRIITGGLVIDFSLKLFGESIYEDYELPDYDFFSTDPAKDASTIFIQLYESGLKNISIIPGMHVNTIRVYVHRDPVADITYISPSLYKQYQKSALKYKDLVFRNTYLQFGDMHRLFSYLYENEPREAINFRLEKDFTRYCKLSKYYTAEIDAELNLTIDIEKVGRIFNPEKLAKLNAAKFFELCTHKKQHNIKDVAYGDLAILFYLREMHPIFAKIQISVENEIITYNGFETHNSILAENPQDYLLDKDFIDSKKYCAFLEYMPARIVGKTKIIYCASNKTSICTANNCTYVSTSFVINYCYSMYEVTKNILYAWLYLLMNKFLYENYASNTPNKLLFPSSNCYGSEHEHHAIIYAKEHPDEIVRVPPVYIREDLNAQEISEQMDKLPRDFKYNPKIYLMDGKHEI
jgi:hypothetical protein